MIVPVGSTNPTKITPVQTVFSHHYTHVIVRGVSVASGVAEQPHSDDEMYQGALNRALEALKQRPEAEYGVGIEGGIHKYSYGWFERSLVVIVDRHGAIGIGSSGGLKLPDVVIARIEKGQTLEEVVDGLFGTQDIGQGVGMFGIFTNGVVTRTDGVMHGVAFALARFLHADIYDKGVSA